jgi:hypothetical protein
VTFNPQPASTPFSNKRNTFWSSYCTPSTMYFRNQVAYHHPVPVTTEFTSSQTPNPLLCTPTDTLNCKRISSKHSASRCYSRHHQIKYVAVLCPSTVSQEARQQLAFLR